jgi:hypothetical protein
MPITSLTWVGRPGGTVSFSKLMLAQGFEALLTVDRNLPFQQNLRTSGIAVVVVVARTNRVKELRPIMPKVQEALGTVKAGQVIIAAGRVRRHVRLWWTAETLDYGVGGSTVLIVRCIFQDPSG